MMRLTYVCQTCGAKVRRADNVGRGGLDVRCQKGHGAMVRIDGRGAPVLCSHVLGSSKSNDSRFCNLVAGHTGPHR